MAAKRSELLSKFNPPHRLKNIRAVAEYDSRLCLTNAVGDTIGVELPMAQKRCMLQFFYKFNHKQVLTLLQATITILTF